MRNMKFRSLILYFVIFAFFAGLGYYIFEFTRDSQGWAFSPVNRHLSNGSLSGGKIFDVNGEVLAQTVNGKRLYHENEDVRKALLHTVGDGSTLIPTSVQSRYNAELFGYNFITGFGAPEYFSSNQDITLTLDSKICASVSKKFGDKKGTALAYNYTTGEVICLVSLPTYDVNNRPDFTKDTEGKYDGVYLNRALSAAYTPGSVFKIFTAMVGIENLPDAETRKYECEKVKIIDGEKVTCMQSHGKLDLKNSLSKSCDIAFCDIAVELGKEKMTRELEKFGFNSARYFEGIELAKSVYDVSNASKADLGWSGIGQYTDTLNPMYMLKIMGALANGGNLVEPFVVKSFSVSGMKESQKLTKTPTKTMISQITADKMKEMMRFTMKNQYNDSLFGGIPMCAKTGTAEVGEDKLPHGWMVGFSYDEKFPVAFVVVVENGDFGIKSAGPIAGAMIKEINSSFAKKLN